MPFIKIKLVHKIHCVLAALCKILTEVLRATMLADMVNVKQPDLMKSL